MSQNAEHVAVLVPGAEVPGRPPSGQVGQGRLGDAVQSVAGERDDRAWLFSSHFDGDREWIDVEVCDGADAWTIEVAHTRAGSPPELRRIEIPKRATGAAEPAEATGATGATEVADSPLLADVEETCTRCGGGCVDVYVRGADRLCIVCQHREGAAKLAGVQAERDKLLAALVRIGRRHALPPDVTAVDIADCAIECADAHEARAYEIVQMCGGEPGADGWREALERVVAERDELRARLEVVGKLDSLAGQARAIVAAPPMYSVLRSIRANTRERFGVLGPDVSAAELARASMSLCDPDFACDYQELFLGVAVEVLNGSGKGLSEDAASIAAPNPSNRPTPPYEDLDAGIRETVRWLFDQGFNPSDSGDGYSKRTDPNNPFFGLQGALDEPHVMMTVADPAALVGEVERLSALLEERGVVLSGAGPRTPEEAEETGVSWEPLPAGILEGSLEGSYAPGGPAVIILTGVDDRALFGVLDAELDNDRDSDCDDGNPCTTADAPPAATGQPTTTATTAPSAQHDCDNLRWWCACCESFIEEPVAVPGLRLAVHAPCATTVTLRCACDDGNPCTDGGAP